jgi:hypothetical protein
VIRATLQQVSSEQFNLSCKSLFSLTAPEMSLHIIQLWYNRPINYRINNGFHFIPAASINEIIIK